MANQNLSQFGEKLFVADADHTFIWDTAASISKRVSRNSWLSGTTADFHLGLADAASPVAQTISVQSVVAGTSNTAGANFSINGSQGTGTGAGGALLLRTAPAGSSGTAQNALVTAVAITSAGNVGIGTTAPSEKLHVLGGKVLFGDATDATGTAGNGDLTLRAYRSPQIHISANNSSGVFYGLNIELNNSIYAGLLLNLSSGEVKIGALAVTYFPTFYSNNVERMRIDTTGNVGIGTTSPTSKLHVAGSSSPSITVDNTLATGASQLLFKNTVVTGDTDGIFLNGSAQSGFGGNGSLNIKATTGPIAFHTNTVTNAFSIAQSGPATFISSIFVGPGTGTGVYHPTFGGVAFLSSGIVGVYGGSSYTTFDKFVIGGVSSAFPAFKRVGTELQVVIASTTAAINVAALDADLTFIEDRYRRKGAGTPEGVVTAPIGAVYHNTTGGAGTSFYVKESGTGNTGWVGK